MDAQDKTSPAPGVAPASLSQLAVLTLPAGLDQVLGALDRQMQSARQVIDGSLRQSQVLIAQAGDHMSALNTPSLVSYPPVWRAGEPGIEDLPPETKALGPAGTANAKDLDTASVLPASAPENTFVQVQIAQEQRVRAQYLAELDIQQRFQEQAQRLQDQYTSALADLQQAREREQQALLTVAVPHTGAVEAAAEKNRVADESEAQAPLVATREVSDDRHKL